MSEDNWGFPGGSDSEESACSAGDLGLIAGLGRSPGQGNGNPPQYSGLENSMDRGPGRLQSMGSGGNVGWKTRLRIAVETGQCNASS